MAHISSIGAAVFTTLAMSGTVTAGVAASLSSGDVATIIADAADGSEAQGKFVTSSSIRSYSLFPNVRAFPAIGQPANIVKVPAYGQKTSSTVSGQADAPSLEITVNYVPTEWLKGASGTAIGNAVGDGKQRLFRLALCTSEPTVTSGVALSKYDSAAGGFGTTENSQFFWVGKLESLLVTPSLTDASTAVLSFSIQSDFMGAYTSS
jgi:hypothetical protein